MKITFCVTCGARIVLTTPLQVPVMDKFISCEQCFKKWSNSLEQTKERVDSMGWSVQ
jgi:transcription elongation factor Elf1